MLRLATITFRKPWQRARQLTLDALAGDLPMVEFALRFTLSHPDVDTVLVGTTSQEHLADNIASAGKGPLPEEVLQIAKSIFDQQFGRS